MVHSGVQTEGGGGGTAKTRFLAATTRLAVAHPLFRIPGDCALQKYFQQTPLECACFLKHTNTILQHIPPTHNTWTTGKVDKEFRSSSFSQGILQQSQISQRELHQGSTGVTLASNLVYYAPAIILEPVAQAWVRDGIHSPISPPPPPQHATFAVNCEPPPPPRKNRNLYSSYARNTKLTFRTSDKPRSILHEVALLVMSHKHDVARTAPPPDTYPTSSRLEPTIRPGPSCPRRTCWS